MPKELVPDFVNHDRVLSNTLEDIERPLFSKRHERELKRLRAGTYNAASSFSVISYCVNVKLICVGDSEFPEQIKKDLDYLANKYNLTYNQCMFLSLVLNTNDKMLSYCNYVRLFNFPLLLMRQFDEELEDLAKREIIFLCYNDDNIDTIMCNDDFYASVMYNVDFEHKDRSDISMEELLFHMRIFDDQQSSSDFLATSCRKLMIQYKGHPLIEKIRQLSSNDNIVFGNKTRLLLMTLISVSVWSPEAYFAPNQYMEEIFNMPPFMIKSTMNRISAYIEGKLPLFTSNVFGLLEYGISDGMADPEKFCMSDAGKEYFGIKNIDMGVNDLKTSYNLTRSDSITEKELFYDEETQKQIDRLFGLLDQNNFVGIQQRLIDNKMRIGFNILLYGSAGTGKTETCLQLSRITGRDIFFVEVNNFKDKFVGESEKRIKHIFNSYNMMVEDYKKADKAIPIMVMNEADAIIGIRKKGAENAVDKMENSVQNIILQEMEKIQGIMIATTNLTENLDSAFERRFIYKVKFNRPNVEAKCKIWASNMPSLSDTEVLKLAEEFDLSGGEIENVVRKCTIENILSGEALSYDMVRDFSINEKLQSEKQRKAVGFR